MTGSAFGIFNKYILYKNHRQINISIFAAPVFEKFSFSIPSMTNKSNADM